MPTPIVDPPAIVKQADDFITAEFFLAEAKKFGRQTVEAAIQCGEALIRSQELWKGKNKDWLAAIKKEGFTKPTAYRLMRKARNAKTSLKMRLDPESIYDDGQPAESTASKKVCRDCRIRGKTYQKDCRACRTLNRPDPVPQADKPIVDEDGEPIPEALQPTWLDMAVIRDFNRQLIGMGKAIDGLAERPSGKGIPAEEMKKKLKALANMIWSYRPGFLCHVCHGEKCETCNHEGWFTNAFIRDQRAQEKFAEYKAKQKAGQL